MALNFTKLKKQPIVFKQLIGLSIGEFEEVVERIRKAWEKREAQKKCDDRPSHLARLEDKVLCLLMYYRTYISQIFLGYLFNLHSSNICRLFKKLEPLLAKKTAIKKNRELTSDKVLELLVNVT